MLQDKSRISDDDVLQDGADERYPRFACGRHNSEEFETPYGWSGPDITVHSDDSSTFTDLVIGVSSLRRLRKARRASVVTKPVAPHPLGPRRPKRCVAMTDGISAAAWSTERRHATVAMDAVCEPHSKSLDRDGYPKTPSGRNEGCRPLFRRARFAHIAAPPKPSQESQKPIVMQPSPEHASQHMACAAEHESQLDGYGNMQLLHDCPRSNLVCVAGSESALAGDG